MGRPLHVCTGSQTCPARPGGLSPENRRHTSWQFRSVPPGVKTSIDRLGCKGNSSHQMTSGAGGQVSFTEIVLAQKHVYVRPAALTWMGLWMHDPSNQEHQTSSVRRNEANIRIRCWRAIDRSPKAATSAIRIAYQRAIERNSGGHDGRGCSSHKPDGPPAIPISDEKL